MSFARLPVALAMVVVVGVSGFLLWRQHGELQRVRAELSAAQSLAGEIEKLRAELERLAVESHRLKSDAVDPNELARLRASVTELNRLKAEKAALEKKLADADAERARAAEAAKADDETASPRNLVRGRATITKGQSLITRGWTLPDGRHGFAVMTPSDIGSERATFQLQVIAAPRSSWAAAGLDWFLEPSQTSIVGAEEILKNAVHDIYSRGGAEPLALMELSGNYLPSDAHMNVPGLQNVPCAILVSPQLAADGQSVDLGFIIQESGNQATR